MRIDVVAVFLAAASAALQLGCSGDSSMARPALATSSDAPAPSATASAGAQKMASAASASAAKPRALTQEMAQPYWNSGAIGAAFHEFALDNWGAARAGFATYLESLDEDKQRSESARVRVIIATCDAKLRKYKAAARGFERAATDLPLIADYLNYEAARARFFAHEPQAALTRAKMVSSSSIRGADAELLIGDLLRARGDNAAVVAHYRGYIKTRPKGIRMAEVHFRLAQALQDDAAASSLQEAATLYRTIDIRWPVGSWGKKARAALTAILPEIPSATRNTLTKLDASEAIERAMALYKAMRNPESAAAFASALQTPGITPAQRCVAMYHQANSWFKERNRTLAAPLFDRAMKLCDATDDIDLRVKAAYQAGRSYDRLSKEKIAAARFARAEAIAAKAKHSYADDSRLRQAEVWAELGNHKKENALLADLAEVYPDGDMRAEAIWRVAWRAYLAKDYKKAARWLEKQITSKAREEKYYAEGQPQYWLGRVYAKLGKRNKSIAAYEGAVRKYPLTYYALLALNRLREHHRARFDALVSELHAAPDDYDPKKPAFEFAPRALWGEPGFLRGIEFLKLNLGWASEAEMARLGLTPPDGKKEVTDPDQREKLWAMALLNHKAGRYQPSHWVTRWHLLGYKRSWPSGHNRARWEIAYPQAWWDLLVPQAKKHGYPIELQIGIVREESAFDPLLESWANAIGLTQMIYPTALRFGKGTGIDITRANLRDPEKNVIIGSNFLGFLWKKWHGHIALIPPSYNAGENATARWLRQRGSWAVDEWAEAIPGDQPRRYSKRVLASYFAYSYLYRDAIPRMRNDIPKRLIPPPRKKRSGKRKRRPKKRANYKR